MAVWWLIILYPLSQVKRGLTCRRAFYKGFPASMGFDREFITNLRLTTVVSRLLSSAPPQLLAQTAPSSGIASRAERTRIGVSGVPTTTPVPPDTSVPTETLGTVSPAGGKLLSSEPGRQSTGRGQVPRPAGRCAESPTGSSDSVRPGRFHGGWPEAARVTLCPTLDPHGECEGAG